MRFWIEESLGIGAGYEAAGELRILFLRQIVTPTGSSLRERQQVIAVTELVGQSSALGPRSEANE
jgi:hypothetical protein